MQEESFHDQDLDEPTIPAEVITPLVTNTKQIFKWVKGKIIGKGSYGAVYLALDAITGDLMAVKQVELPKTTSDQNDNEHINALIAENDMLKNLNHSNIVQYLGFEQSTDYLTIFFEYVPGGSIGYCLREYGKFDRDLVQGLTSQILAGLEYLHSRCISHCNLTVDNILLSNSGVCKISISKSSGQGGTKMDIWCLGCALLEMRAGRRLWDQNDIKVLQFEQTPVPPIPDDVILDELEDDFRRKCFAIDGNEPTAAELRRHAYLK